MPLSELQDKTQRFRAEIQERAEASHMKDMLKYTPYRSSSVTIVSRLLVLGRAVRDCRLAVWRQLYPPPKAC
jgi:hypothetical protein